MLSHTLCLLRVTMRSCLVDPSVVPDSGVLMLPGVLQGLCTKLQIIIKQHAVITSD